ncbi:AAA family ATPase [Corynebacterium sanguinis]|uniref:HelD family protein n=1 Tax=Corynebacterium sanguinis TaxID=2594913 RepID=UPI00223B03BB|nr:ATP-binding domain-containing protein [Corynebacterium sanguinis]MCT1883526.1 AAA family ATPase [Corynebacterium sanguinis]MCT2154873.1 AAA family ATPase [Corynebacterium sanguinis]
MTHQGGPRLSGSPEIDREQAYADMLFSRLDAEVAAARAQLDKVQADVDPDNPDSDALVRRETQYHALNAKLDTLNVAEVGLVFGRLDIADSDADNPVEGRPELDRRYIGRIGMEDRADNYRTLLLDWRAPMARPYYLATTAHPEGVETRRTIRMRGRTVTAVDDEVLSGEGASDRLSDVGSEAALRAAMNAARTGRMRSIVETIQREQDEIIRDATRGVLVVQGGPGTGKTAVALHRVAYLLYTWREQLSRAGVLIVGPNATFLDYISRVLPELGETGVVLSTVDTLVPGFTPESHRESTAAREVKGSAEMVTVLKRAVQRLETVPDEPVALRIGSVTIEATPAMVKAARTRARRSRKPHNAARPVFAEHLTQLLAEALAHRIGEDPLGGVNLLSAADVDQLHDDLAEEPQVQSLIDAHFPALEPTSVLEGLLTSREAIAEVASDYDDYTREALYRPPGSPTTPADTALVDELAELIGVPDPEEARRAEEDEWRRQVAEAEDALDILSSSASTDNDDDQFEAEILSAHDIIDAETLARRQRVTDVRSTAERAREDHTWAYGHVIVDEAQELSPMEWRMVFRRSPSRWMTLVGDTAQTSAPSGTDDWAATLEPFVGTRFKVHELSVNYRTPAEIMVLADRILAEIDPEAQPATAIRSTGHPVRVLPSGVQPPSPSDGRTSAVITADNVAEIKGLEFDHVTVVEPQELIDASPQGWQDLYVAVTRATQTLTVIGDVEGGLLHGVDDHDVTVGLPGDVGGHRAQ